MAEASTLNVLNYFDFWHAVPIDSKEGVSFDEISKKVDLPYDVVRRVLEHAISNRFFDKVDHTVKGHDIRVVHNSHSAVLHDNEDLAGDVTNQLDHFGPPLMTLARALEKWTKGKDKLCIEMGKLPFNYAYSGGYLGKHDTVWEYVEEDGEGDRKGWRQGEMVKAMRYLKTQLDFKETMLFSLTDWNNPPNAHVVNVRGALFLPPKLFLWQRMF